MAKKAAAQKGRADLRVSQDAQQRVPATKLKPSSLLDTRVIYCGDNLEQLAKLPDACVDLIYIDPPFNSNRNYEVFWGSPREITSRATTPHCRNVFHGARPRKSAPLKTATRTPRLTLTTCARAACNSSASSKRPAAFITLRLARQPLRQGHA